MDANVSNQAAKINMTFNILFFKKWNKIPLLILIFVLVGVWSCKAQTKFYDIEIEFGEYFPLTEYDIIFDGRIQEKLDFAYRYDFLLEAESTFFGRQCEEIIAGIDGRIEFVVNSSITSNGRFFGSNLENRRLTFTNQPSYIKKSHIETDTSKAIVVQYENFGLKFDLESSQSTDHWINFQIWYHNTGDIQFVMGPTNLEASPFYDKDLGFLNINNEPFGFPRLGINHPHNDFDTILYYIQGHYENPTINFGHIPQDALLGMPPTGWTVTWRELVSENEPIENVTCLPESGFAPFTYEGGEIMWKYTLFDSSMRHIIKPIPPPTFGGFTQAQSTMTGYNHYWHTDPVDMVVKNDYIITTDRTVYYAPSGAEVHKIDINTGEVLWRNRFDFRDDGLREYPIKTEVVDDIVLVYGLHLNHPFETDLSQRGVLFTRTYDLETGDLLNHTFGDINDPAVFVDRYISSDYRNEFNRIGLDTFEILETVFLEDRPVILRNLMKTNGIPFISDTIKGIMDEPNLSETRKIPFNKVRKISPDSFVFIEDFHPNEDSGLEPYFIINLINKNLDIIYSRTYNNSGIGAFDGVYLEDADENFIRLRTFFPSTRHFIFDTKTGQYLSTRFEDDKFDDLGEREILETNITDSLELVSVLMNKLGNIFREDDEKGELEFILSSEKGDTSTNILSPSQYRYYIIPKQVVLLDDYDILMRVYEARWSFSNKYLPAFYSYMRIDSEELLGITSTEDIIDLPSFAISPNPALNYVRIIYPSVFNGKVLIYNTEGYLVIQSSCNDDRITLDISDLPSGLYTIRSIGNDSSFEYKSQKLIITR